VSRRRCNSGAHRSVAVLLLLGGIAACEESTSGADREATRSRFDPDPSAETGGTENTGNASECGAVTEIGACDGNVLSYCEEGSLYTGDCRSLGDCECGLDVESGFNACLCTVGAGGTAGSGGTAGGAAGTAGIAGTAGNTNGGSSTAGSGGTAGSSPAELETAIARAVDVDCGRLSSCSNTLLEFWYGGIAGCRAQTREVLEWLSALTESGVTAVALDECAGAIEGATCEQFFSAVPLESCVYHGTRPLGGACIHSAQCESGYCPSSDFMCAVCTAWPNEGASCQTSVNCPLGMTCTSTGVCALPAKRGEPCSAAKPCDLYLQCHETCEPWPATAGAECGSSTPFPNCDSRAGFGCSNATDGTCMPLAPVSAGTSCAPGDGNLNFCRSFGSCTNNVCVAGPTTGDTCNPSAGVHCPVTDACIGGRCTAVPNPTICDG
jgi:hypothetical protein